jgi:hypothetical protein
MHQSRFDPEARRQRLEVLMQFLRLHDRGDGVVMATSEDILRGLEESGEPVHGLRTVRAYLADLRDAGKLETLPYSQDLQLPPQQGRYNRQVVRLIPQARS